MKFLKHNVTKILMIIAVLIILLSFNMTVFSPFEQTYQLQQPLTMALSGNAKVLVDRQGQNIVFVNEDNKVERLVDVSKIKKVEEVNDVEMDGAYVYVAGVTKKTDGVTVDKARILKYTRGGKFLETLYEYIPKSDAFVSPIMDIEVEDGHVYAFFRDEVNAIDFSVEEVYPDQRVVATDKARMPIVFANYNQKKNVVTVVDYLGYCVKYDYNTGNVTDLELNENELLSCYVVTDSGYEIVSDCLSENFYVDDYAYADDCIVQRIYADGDVVSLCDRTNDMAYVFRAKDAMQGLAEGTLEEYEGFDYSIKVLLLNWLIYVAYIYFTVFVLWHIVKSLRRLVLEKNYERLKVIGRITAVIVGICGIVIFYSVKMYNTRLDTMGTFVESVAGAVSNVADDSFMKSVDEFGYTGTGNAHSYEERLVAYQNIDHFFEKFAKGIKIDACDFFLYYAVSGEDYRVIYSDVLEYQIGMPLASLGRAYLNADNEHAQVLFSSKNVALCCADEVYKDGAVVGKLVYGIYYQPYREQLLRNCIELILTLLVAASGLYMVFMEAKEILAARRKKKELFRANSPADVYVFSRQYSFLVYFVSSMDFVVAVLIVKDLCNAAGYADGVTIGLISALPMILSVASVFGSFIYTLCISRFSTRNFSAVCALLMCIMAAFQAVGVKSHSIVIYFAARFLFYFFQGNVFVLAAVLPNNAPDEETRFAYHKSVTWSAVSAGIISGIVGGYAAQYLGNESIYIIGAVSCFALAALSVKIFKKGECFGRKKDESDESSKLSAKIVLKLITSPEILLYIVLISLPFSILKNYKGILFPMVTSDFNLPKVFVTNLYIIARTLNLVCSGFIRVSKGKRNMKMSSAILTIGCGLMFAGFLFINPLVWSIVMVVITDMYCKSAGPINKMIVQRGIEKLNISTEKGAGILGVFTPLVSCIQTPLVAFFLGFSTNAACIAIGVFVLGCAALYALFSRKG